MSADQSISAFNKALEISQRLGLGASKQSIINATQSNYELFEIASCQFRRDPQHRNEWIRLYNAFASHRKRGARKRTGEATSDPITDVIDMSTKWREYLTSTCKISPSVSNDLLSPFVSPSIPPAVVLSPVELQSLCDRLHSQIAELNDENASLKSINSTLSEQCNQHRLENDRLVQELQSSKERFAVLELTKSTESENELVSSSNDPTILCSANEIQSLRSQVAAFECEIALLKSSIDRMQGENVSLKSSMEAANAKSQLEMKRYQQADESSKSELMQLESNHRVLKQMLETAQAAVNKSNPSLEEFERYLVVKACDEILDRFPIHSDLTFDSEEPWNSMSFRTADPIMSLFNVFSFTRYNYQFPLFEPAHRQSKSYRVIINAFTEIENQFQRKEVNEIEKNRKKAELVSQCQTFINRVWRRMSLLVHDDKFTHLHLGGHSTPIQIVNSCKEFADTFLEEMAKPTPRLRRPPSPLPLPMPTSSSYRPPMSSFDPSRSHYHSTRPQSPPPSRDGYYRRSRSRSPRRDDYHYWRSHR